MAQGKTPMVDQLEKGPWPSYVKEIKRMAKKNPAAKDLLEVQELSFKDKVTHWKHGGIVGVTGKSKIKIAGCLNDGVAATARSDFSIIGTWRDSLRIDQAAVREYVKAGFDIKGRVIDKCPTRALAWNEKAAELKLKPEDCVRCMHCINKMPKALRPGLDRGATILIGGKSPLVKGAYLSWVLVPFMKMCKSSKKGIDNAA